MEVTPGGVMIVKFVGLRRGQFKTGDGRIIGTPETDTPRAVERLEGRKSATASQESIR
jgi:hypothetical protein